MFNCFPFHQKYLRHPNIPIRILYVISCCLSAFLLAAIWCVVGIFLVIQHGRYNVVTIQLKSPYKIESKAAIMTVLSLGREDYLDEWAPTLSNYASKWEKKLYTDIGKKIPKGDLLLDILLYRINHSPKLYNCKKCTNYISTAKELLSNFKYKHSVIRGANLYWKPQYINRLIFNLLQDKYEAFNKNQANLEDLRSYLRDVLYDGKDKDDPLYNFRQLLLVEADCAILKKMLLNKYPQQSKQWCQAKEYITWHESVDEVYPEVVKLKDDPEVMGTYVAKSSIEYIEKQKEELDDFDKQYCKVQ